MKHKLLTLLLTALLGLTGMNAWSQDYEIGTAQDLVDFAAAVNGGTTGANAVLTADIDLDGVAWTPIGSESNPYTGTFDGQGFTIANLNYTSTANNTGFFGQIGNGAVVKGFTIGGTITSLHQRVSVIGSVAAGASATISYIHSIINLTCSQTRHGGVLGAQNGTGTVNIDHCTFSGTLDAGNTIGNFGGIVGLTNNNSGSIVNITNCLFDGTVKNGTGTNAGGIVGYTNKTKVTITNCLSNGIIESANPGLFFGQLNASNSKWSGVNYYMTTGSVIGTIENNAKLSGTAPTQATSEQLTSGELCYLLNGNVSGGTNWYQTLGTDDYPLPYGTDKVYANGYYYCDMTPKEGSTVTYSNTEGSIVDPHSYTDGICSVCGSVDATYMTANSEGFYEIGTPAQLKWFSAWVNSSSDNLASNVVLTDDIDMTSIAATWIPIGDWHTGNVNSAYKGHFNGQGHEISNFNVTTSQSYYGIFGVISAATIEDFSIRGTITNNDDYTNIGVIGYSRDTEVNIQNIQSYLTITNNANNKNVGGILGCGSAGTTNVNCCAFFGTINAADKTNAGGIVGYFNNGNTSIVNITNCLFEGTISSEIDNSYCGGMAGYGGANVNSVKIINCLSLGSIIAPISGQFFGRILNTGSSITNCYYQGDNINGTGSSALTTIEATPVSDTQLSSGEVCYLLNGDQAAIVWYQTIGTNDEPTLDATNAQVYVNGTVCPDTGAPQGTVSYSNTPGTTVGSHVPVDGFCTYCGILDASYMTPVDGNFEIGTSAQLKWFAVYVNQVAPASNAVLTADIDLTGVDWTPIGNSSVAYTGTFDGQGKTISNFTYTATATHNGLFGSINGATIQNFCINGSLTSDKNYSGVIGYSAGASNIKRIHSSLDIDIQFKGWAGGVVGGATGAIVIEECWFDGTFDTHNFADAKGGILGYANSATIKNCLFSGTFTGEDKQHYGGILGYINDGTFGGVQNCLSMGSVTTTNVSHNGVAAIIGNINNSAKLTGITNNYWLTGSSYAGYGGSKAGSAEAPHEVTTEQLASGEVAYGLGAAWSQFIGTDTAPVIGTDAPVSYVGAAGYATMYDTTTGYELNGDAKAYVTTLNGNGYSQWLDLSEIENVPANTPVVLGGTYYNKIAADLPAINVANVLKGTATDTEADGTMYVLAMPAGEKVGFYLATTGTIKAGKAYLQLPEESGIKAFYFGGEDDATSINEELRVKNEEFAPVYNLAGQRLQKMQKGVNIMGGRKVLK